ncbi:hypothetical protein LTR36_007935 [Oleoguttula mirabilis]|uniref:Zn(2)-C6 fungal-type domain-containing protein n=1 Tax=Oleoguttula mirabilis TaxID=1507867 RepID=A0AAV9J9T2_9PEZI|nr:hypothetical protein LTR36_007935 [Oleoguttula mirabilis]
MQDTAASPTADASVGEPGHVQHDTPNAHQPRTTQGTPASQRAGTQRHAPGQPRAAGMGAQNTGQQRPLAAAAPASVFHPRSQMMGARSPRQAPANVPAPRQPHASGMGSQPLGQQQLGSQSQAPPNLESKVVCRRCEMKWGDSANCNIIERGGAPCSGCEVAGCNCIIKREIRPHFPAGANVDWLPPNSRQKRKRDDMAGGHSGSMPPTAAQGTPGPGMGHAFGMPDRSQQVKNGYRETARLERQLKERDDTIHNLTLQLGKLMAQQDMWSTYGSIVQSQRQQQIQNRPSAVPQEAQSAELDDLCGQLKKARKAQEDAYSEGRRGGYRQGYDEAMALRVNELLRPDINLRSEKSAPDQRRSRKPRHDTPQREDHDEEDDDDLDVVSEGEEDDEDDDLDVVDDEQNGPPQRGGYGESRPGR